MPAGMQLIGSDPIGLDNPMLCLASGLSSQENFGTQLNESPMINVPDRYSSAVEISTSVDTWVRQKV